MDENAVLPDENPDWLNELSREQQRDVLEGIAEADRDKTVPHAEVVKLLEKWGLK